MELSTMAHRFAVRAFLFGSTCGGSRPLANSAVFRTDSPNPRMDEMLAIFRNCLLFMPITHSPSVAALEVQAVKRPPAILYLIRVYQFRLCENPESLLLRFIRLDFTWT